MCAGCLAGRGCSLSLLRAGEGVGEGGRASCSSDDEDNVADAAHATVIAPVN